jgi:hypothetical protein
MPDLGEVWCLGDSFTFGHGVDYDQSYVGLLSADVKPRWHFCNTAVPGYGPVQYRQLLQYHLDRGSQPSAVLVGTYVGNDFFDCIWGKDIPVVDGILGERKTWKTPVKRNSHLYRLCSKIYHNLFLRSRHPGLKNTCRFPRNGHGETSALHSNDIATSFVRSLPCAGNIRFR